MVNDDFLIILKTRILSFRLQFLFVKSFFLLFSLTICVNCRLAAQLQIKDPAIGTFKNEGSDSLFAKYLSDTLNACSKIKELVEQAKRFGEKPEERIVHKIKICGPPGLRFLQAVNG